LWIALNERAGGRPVIEMSGYNGKTPPTVTVWTTPEDEPDWKAVITAFDKLNH
jgi:hypothetical protein